MSRKQISRKEKARVPGVDQPAASGQDSGAGTPAQSIQSRSGWKHYLLSALPVVLIIGVALAVYANAWPNALVHDDKFYAGSERFVELSNIPRYFKENAWASSGVAENLYRPLLLTSVTLDARIYGDWVAGYHLSNIFLHALVALLVYGFLLQLLRMTNRQSGSDTYFALLAALVFAVHPVYTEVVNSIFNRSGMLVALGGLAGLLWFLRHMDSRPARAWAGLGLAYLLVLFCKETAIVLPGLAVMLVLILAAGDWRIRVRKCLPVFWLLIPLALYLVLRAQALAPVEVSPAASAPDAGAMLDSFQWPGWYRLMKVAGLYFESFKLMVWPVPIALTHETISQFAQVAGLVLILVWVATALFQFRRGHSGLLLALGFFCIAILPSSRIIGDPSGLPHLAERYLYFPSVGLAIALAFGLRFLARKVDINLLASAVVLAMILLAPVTWARNAVWASEIQLFESEYSNGNRERSILVWLVAAHLKNSGLSRVAEICDRHVDVQESYGKLSTNCAVAYNQLGRLDEAERAYLFGTTHKAVKAIAHANLGRFYLAQYRWGDAKKHFEAAVDAETRPANRAYRQGHMLVRLYPENREKLLEAKAYFEQALELQPNYSSALHWLERVNRALGMP
jgi:tetratricopeptide (TPR) repeat protein